MFLYLIIFLILAFIFSENKVKTLKSYALVVLVVFVLRYGAILFLWAVGDNGYKYYMDDQVVVFVKNLFSSRK